MSKDRYVISDSILEVLAEREKIQGFPPSPPEQWVWLGLLAQHLGAFAAAEYNGEDHDLKSAAVKLVATGLLIIEDLDETARLDRNEFTTPPVEVKRP